MNFKPFFSLALLALLSVSAQGQVGRWAGYVDSSTQNLILFKGSKGQESFSISDCDRAQALGHRNLPAVIEGKQEDSAITACHIVKRAGFFEIQKGVLTNP